MNTAPMFSSATPEWSTPPDFFERLSKLYGPFELDPCATEENTTCENFYDKEFDGLTRPWFGRVFCNPPYGRGIGEWVDKAIVETEPSAENVARAPDKRALRVVMLVPARVDTAWFQRAFARANNLWFVRGRLKFGGCENSAPFPSAVFVFSFFRVPLEVGYL